MQRCEINRKASKKSSFETKRNEMSEWFWHFVKFFSLDSDRLSINFFFESEDYSGEWRKDNAMNRVEIKWREAIWNINGNSRVKNWETVAVSFKMNLSLFVLLLINNIISITTY